MWLTFPVMTERKSRNRSGGWAIRARSAVLLHKRDRSMLYGGIIGSRSGLTSILHELKIVSLTDIRNWGENCGYGTANQLLHHP